MIAQAPPCPHEEFKKHGRDIYGQQRYRCKACGLTWIEDQAKPLGDMRIPMDKAVYALRMILEGMPVRGVERMTGLHRDTILSLIVTTGDQCATFLRKRIHGVPVKEVECDELWGFIYCKEKTREQHKWGEEVGDCYCYVSMERTTKCVLNFLVGRRTSECTWEFINDLFFATSGRFQVSTDGYGPYQAAIPLIFQFDVDFAQLVKRFGGSTDMVIGGRYSPAKIIGTKATRGCGKPDMDRVCTSHSERLNLSLRMNIRRLTRLTNGHSKKRENHAAMLGLYFAWYNFVRIHTTLRKTNKTPAVAQGLTDHVWTIEELLTEAAKAAL